MNLLIRGMMHIEDPSGKFFFFAFIFSSTNCNISYLSDTSSIMAPMSLCLHSLPVKPTTTVYCFSDDLEVALAHQVDSELRLCVCRM